MTIPAIAPYAMPTAPVANRVDWRPDASRAVFLIHDMQAYFLNKFDTAQSPIVPLVHTVARLRAQCDAAGVPVFYTAQPTEQPPNDRALLNDFWGPGLTAPEHRGAQPIIDALAPKEGDTVLTKWRYSAFQRSDLRARMAALGRDQLIICGVYAHIGCMATALEAFMQDVQPFMVIDGVADFSAAEHDMAVNYVARRCGVSLTADAVMAALAASVSAGERANVE